MQEAWNSYVIGDYNALRQVLRSLSALRSLAFEGDVISATIVQDLELALRHTKTDAIQVITPRQFEAIDAYLIQGYSMNEVCKRTGLDRRRVFHHIRKGLQSISAYLQENEPNVRRVHAWQRQYIANNAHLPRAELARAIGKPLNSVYQIIGRLRKSGLAIPNRSGGHVAGPGPKEPRGLEERLVSPPVAATSADAAKSRNTV